MFADRTEAGRELANRLALWRARRPMVLGLPRGGVVVAAEVARNLGGELDVLLVKKLRAPDNPELAIGAVHEDGRIFLNDEIVSSTGADADYIESERQTRVAEMNAQRRLYRNVKRSVSVSGRSVILVDDGLATGATMIAAVQSVAGERPAELIVAVPVGPLATIETIQRLAGVSAVLCLQSPVDFQGVGQFYRDFRQTTDAEVVEILKHENTRR